MGFAMAVYSTHRNWKAVVERPKEAVGPGKELGLQFQLQNAKDENEELKLKLEKLDAQLAAEEAAYRQNLAKLETERAELDKLRQQAQSENEQLVQQNRTLTGTVDATQQNLSRLVEEVAKLRDEIRVTQQQIDANFDKVVTTTDELHSTHGELERLQERLNQLTATLGTYKQKLTANGISPDAPLADVPPALKGVVTAVRRGDLIEVSIGADDGLRVGHTIEVYRGQTYLGRAEIVQTAPDRAVAKILKDYHKGVVQAGDQVATRLNKVS
jgi:multidrug efflux pump subunit AcrA (membrane-fusion protein)